MRTRLVNAAWFSARVGLTLFALFGTAQMTRAEVPMLAIRLANGETAIHSLGDVEKIGFEGDTLVVVDGNESDRYGAESIVRIDFLMNLTGTEPLDPETFVKAIRLFQNWPNPFWPETRIDFELPRAGRVEVGIYSVSGRLIRVLVDETRDAGPHEVVWDGRNDAGEKIGGGVYFYKLVAAGVEESRRMILLP